MGKSYFLVLLMAVLISACSGIPAATISPFSSFPHSMKGYELYSWPVEADWRFTLITGTNRLKTVDEITGDENVEDTEGWVKFSVTGEDALKETLARLPAGEQIFWVGGQYLFFDVLKLPPQDIVNDIERYCQELGLRLSVVE
jgi:hypothetical protein